MATSTALTGAEYKALAQRAKAEKLANLLHESHIRSDGAKLLTQENWGQLAVAARVNSPSAETQAITIQMLRDRENAALAVAGFEQPREIELIRAMGGEQ